MLFPPQHVTIVGVLNITPDSFSDGGRFVREGTDPDVAAAVAAGRELERQGAHVLDVGGESTRPGAATLAPGVEADRVVPVIEALAKALPTPLSVDTRKAAVACRALQAGARIVNDVSGLRHDPELAAVVAEHGAGLILGHLRGEPASMQDHVRFGDVLEEVGAELEASVARAQAQGVPRARIAVDPGIGFGKTLEHNLTLLAGAGQLGRRLGLPVLVGPSRKSFLGRLTGDPPAERDLVSAVACALAIYEGVAAVRVHDVASAVRAARVASALRRARAALPEGGPAPGAGPERTP